MTVPQIAKLLGVKRDAVHTFLKSKKNRRVFEIIVVADKKRITNESFEKWYRNQTRFQKVSKKTSGLQTELKKATNPALEALLCSNRTSFITSEAVMLIGVSREKIYLMLKEEVLDSFKIGKMIRIRRADLEWWLSPQDTVFRREKK